MRRLGKLKDSSAIPSGVLSRPALIITSANQLVNMEGGFLMTIAVAIASEHNQCRSRSVLHMSYPDGVNSVLCVRRNDDPLHPSLDVACMLG